MKKICFYLFFLSFPSILCAKNYTLSGYITDLRTGESLIGASVYDSQSKQGSLSNPYGFYSITLPEGTLALRFSYVGYSNQELNFMLTKDTTVNIRLEGANLLKEVTVVAQASDRNVHSTQMSAVEVPVAQIKSIPALFGEVDVIKALQLLPGVQAGTEGASGLYVRGGGPDQNLLLLDGVPVYNVNHMFGFFSVFNPDAIKNVTLYKGSFPARFGGRLSSVLDIRMNDGHMQEYHGNVVVGLLSSKINLEGPIWKDRTSFNISFRRTYFDILAQPFIRFSRQSQEHGNNMYAGYFFYDFNAKINHKFSDRDRLYLSTYLGDDGIYARIPTYLAHEKRKVEESLNWDWGNLITALRWNRVLSNRLFMNTTATYTRYRFLMKMINSQEDAAKGKTELGLAYNSGIEDWGLKTDFDFLPNPKHDIKFGLGYTRHAFSPGVASFKGDVPEDIRVSVGERDNVTTQEIAAYAEDNISLTDFLKTNVGLHYSFFRVQQRPYHSLQPRLSARLLLSNSMSFKISYAYMTQYIHLLSNNNISLPTDLWVPVTKRISPMVSQQASAGFFYTLEGIADFSVEAYYKTMDNLLEYKDGATFFGSSTGWEDKVSMGRGWSYGVEVLVQRSFGNTTGWIGYTWAKADRLFDRPGSELNFGQVFPAKYDRRHDISLVLSHKFNERIDVAATWVYSTGNAGTLPLQQYYGMSYPFWSGKSSYGSNEKHPGIIEHVQARNNFRYPDYHRLDFGINFHRRKKHGSRTWNISVYNAYNQLNPFMIYQSSKMVPVYNPITGTTHNEEHKTLKLLSIFPILPSVSYSYKF